MERCLSDRWRSLPALLVLLPVLTLAGCGGGGGGGEPAAGSSQSTVFVLHVGVTGQLPPGSTAINGASISLTLPAGVTVSGDAASAVTVSSQAAALLQAAFVTYTPATTATGAKVSFLLFLTKPASTLTGGALAAVQCTLAPGVVLHPADVQVSGFVTNQIDAEIAGASIVILP